MPDDSGSESAGSCDSLSVDAAGQGALRNPYLHTPKVLPVEAQVNVLCDRLATETSRAILDGGSSNGLPLVLQPPFPGSRAMLRIGKTWITSKLATHVYRARRTPAARVYCKQKYGWDDEILDSVNWPSIGRVRRRHKTLSYSKFRQSSRYMHGWLPTMHMRQHITGFSQCPGCPSTKETMRHMMLCPHALMKQKREEILAGLRKKRLEARLPRAVIDALYAVVRSFFLSSGVPDASRQLPLQRAVSAQSRIGIHMMIRGFVAAQWEIAMDELGVSKPDSKADTILRLMWEEVLTPLWNTRNDILHRQNNAFREVEGDRLAERIQWYFEHKQELLSVHDHHLARFDVATIHRMNCETRRQWVRHLDIARAAYENELAQRADNQPIITRYFSVVPPAVETINPNPE